MEKGISFETRYIEKLLNEEESYFNKRIMDKFIDVEIKNDSAILTVVLILKKIWDKKDIKQEQKSL